MLKLLLDQNWEFKEYRPGYDLAREFASAEDWRPATVPGTIHQDLLAAGAIPDPFYGLNEQEVQWVGERDWLYRCSFDLPDDFNENESAASLCFEGLDTFATVWLNGRQILVSDNMFIPQRLEVGGQLETTGNRLEILFESAFRRGEALEAEYGRLQDWNGAPSRLYVRKAQYHYGWDWGPVLLTAGVWREVRLEAFEARIADLACPVELNSDLSQATIAVRLEVENFVKAGELVVELTLLAPDGHRVATETVPVTASMATYTFEVTRPDLWWPHGYGGQPLYKLVAVLKANGRELDRSERRLGLRKLRLVQESLENEPGKTFLFEVNNTPVFCGGANWIPSDSFTPRITAARYRAHLELAARANMVMLRVWGGGIYEDAVFYDCCDELGLLVWQDFLFACGIYPAHDRFLQSVKAEAEAVVKRLRHHACLALWCGNNEDYAIAESLGVYDASFEGDFTRTAFPARAIYEQLLPEVCARLDPGRTYWPGSPYAGQNSADQTVGDRHTWEVWHGPMADYHDYPQYAGRFVSEFGMESLPSLETIKSFAPEGQQYPYSRVMEFHNRSEGGQRRLAAYLSDNLPMVSNMKDYQYATQFIQAEAMAFAMRGWRRKWGGPNRYAVAGALVWQLNDCWPVTSWALIDYNLHPKPAYYTLQREMAPVALGLWNGGNGRAAFWGVNSYTPALTARLCLTAFDLRGQKQLEEWQLVTLKPNQATELGEIAYRARDGLVFYATLLQGKEVLARATLWPEPFKYLKLPDPELQIVRLAEDKISLQARRPAKGVFLTADRPVIWSDNMFDLLPGETRFITATGLGSGGIKACSLDSLFSNLCTVVG